MDQKSILKMRVQRNLQMTADEYPSLIRNYRKMKPDEMAEMLWSQKHNIGCTSVQESEWKATAAEAFLKWLKENK